MRKLTSGVLWAAFLLIVGCNPVTAQPDGQSTSATAIVINEILAHTDPPQKDAVELYNPTAAAIDISAWILADDNNAEQRYVIPSGTILAPGAYHIVPLDENTSFRLSEFGETVFLFQPGAGAVPGPLVDRARFGVSPNGVSFGPIMLSTGEVHQVLLQTPTLGSANALPRIGPLVIDELMYRPAAGLDEYVALRNAGAAATPLCDLNGTGLPAVLRVDDDDAFTTLPCGPLLAPGERIFIAEGSAAALRGQYDIPADVLVVGPFSGRLSNEGELVEIVWPQPPETGGDIAYYALDQVDYAATAPWPVLADGIALVRRAPVAYGADPANWRAANEAPLTRRVWLPWVGK